MVSYIQGFFFLNLVSELALLDLPGHRFILYHFIMHNKKDAHQTTLRSSQNFTLSLALLGSCTLNSMPLRVLAMNFLLLYKEWSTTIFRISFQPRNTYSNIDMHMEAMILYALPGQQ